jgi:hypothetical protein
MKIGAIVSLIVLGRHKFELNTGDRKFLPRLLESSDRSQTIFHNSKQSLVGAQFADERRKLVNVTGPYKPPRRLHLANDGASITDHKEVRFCA